ncbi:MAG: hypothetical protein J7K58_01380 [Euryarchaeota archaeon]|nr:hypothetical protein [Euryarchaeota archaeon]
MRGRSSILEYLKTILKELDKGFKPKDLDNRFNGHIPHDTLYRILNVLKEADLVYVDKKGRYQYKWKKGIREYSKKNYEIAMNHSKLLLESKNLEELVENEHFLKHLKTGYPDIYELYMNWKNAKENVKKAEEDFENAIKREILEAGFKITGKLEKSKGKVVSTAILDLIKYLYLSDIRDIELESDEDKVYCESFRAVPISLDPSAIPELKDLIIKLINSKRLRKIYEKYAKLRDEESNKWSELEKKLTFLISKVEHGEPLKGFCDLCPIVIIKDEEEEEKTKRGGRII